MCSCGVEAQTGVGADALLLTKMFVCLTVYVSHKYLFIVSQHLQAEKKYRYE